MISNIEKKLNSQAGESISETLIALLIAALALVMLAGAISAAGSIITTSRNKLEKYYNPTEEESDSEDSNTGNGTITNGDFNISIPIEFSVNAEFGENKKIISYKLSESSESNTTDD